MTMEGIQNSLQSKPAQRPWKESKQLLATFPPRAGHHSSAPCSCGHPVAEEISWISCRSAVKSSGLLYGQMPKETGSHTMISQDEECQEVEPERCCGWAQSIFPPSPLHVQCRELFSRSVADSTSTIPDFKFLWLLIQLLFATSPHLQTHKESECGNSSAKGCPWWGGIGPLLNIPPPHLKPGNAPLQLVP